MAEDFRSQGPLCLILLSYVRSLDAIDAQLQAHVDWLERGFAEGLFLVAGRRDPRTGGVILVRGRKPEVEKLAQSDPFVASGVAEAEVVAFNASFAAPALAQIIE